MILWLDDERDPRQHGYIGAYWAKTYEQAIEMLSTGKVELASLDHDIGACADCIAKGLHIGDMKTAETTFYNRCPHAKNGYDVVSWMKENNVWPPKGVRVHSMNPLEGDRMRQAINAHYQAIG